MNYQLHYWPHIQGRGEFVRLALEAAGAPYVDVARGDEAAGQGMPALHGLLQDKTQARPPFACPVLVDDKRVIAQTAAILYYLGPRLKLVGRSEVDQAWAHQVQLTIADVVNEVHNTHHPISAALHFEDQQAEAVRAAQAFLAHRLPKYLAWFEAALRRNPARGGDGNAPRLVGGRLSYPDLSLFQLVEGLRYAFPLNAVKALAKAPAVRALHASVAQQKRVAAYLASPRRIAFNNEGIFRHYPALDPAPQSPTVE